MTPDVIEKKWQGQDDLAVKVKTPPLDNVYWFAFLGKYDQCASSAKQICSIPGVSRRLAPYLGFYDVIYHHLTYLLVAFYWTKKQLQDQKVTDV